MKRDMTRFSGWTAENQYVEEVGSMNIFFKIKGDLAAPHAGRQHPARHYARHPSSSWPRIWGIDTNQTFVISRAGIYGASLDGSLEEVFGSGTAAVVSPVGELILGGQAYHRQRRENGAG